MTSGKEGRRGIMLLLPALERWREEEESTPERRRKSGMGRGSVVKMEQWKWADEFYLRRDALVL